MIISDIFYITALLLILLCHYFGAAYIGASLSSFRFHAAAASILSAINILKYFLASLFSPRVIYATFYFYY